MTNVSSDSTSSSSPRLRGGGKNLPSPWATIVRGESESNPPPPATVSPSKGISSSKEAAEKEVVVVVDSESSPPPPTPKVSSETVVVVVEEMVREESPDHGNEKAKKPAWNKPSNGAVEVGNVMGASSWPALSESAKASPKSSSDSLKNLSDGSTAVTQGPVIASVPQKQVNVNANPSSTPNHQFPIRQKSFKRAGGGGGTGSGSGSGSGTGGSAANGGGVSYVQPPPPPPPPPMVDVHRSGRPGPLFPPVLPNSSPRDPHHKNHNWENGPRGSQSHIGGNDHSHQRNFRRGSNGPHPRGDGSNHRRDQDRGNHDWHPHRGFGGRDLHVQHRGVPRNFIRPPPPPPSPVPFIPPSVRPFGNHMGYPDIQQMYIYQFQAPESFRGVPIVHSAPIMLVPGSHDPNMLAPDLNLPSILMKQIDYYFSPENLCKDRFLRGHMDEQGWVPVKLIATFPRVQELTNSIQDTNRVHIVLETMRNSTIVEVQGDKIRKRNDWMHWLLPQSNQDMLANRVQNIGLEGGNSSNGSISSSDGQVPIPSRTGPKN